jgi:hypothetical protein
MAMLPPRTSERLFLIALGLVYVALAALSLYAIHATQAHPGFYVIALLWPWIVFGLANVLIVAVPLLAVLTGYRYGYLSYEVAVALALAFLGGSVYLAWRYR